MTCSICIASSACVHICTAQHITKQQYNWCSGVVIGHLGLIWVSLLFHTGTMHGKLSGHYSSAVSIGSIHLFHVSACLPTSLCRQSSWQTTNGSLLFRTGGLAVVHHAREPHQNTGIHGAFQGIHRSREPWCNKCWVNDTLRHTIIPHEYRSL